MSLGRPLLLTAHATGIAHDSGIAHSLCALRCFRCHTCMSHSLTAGRCHNSCRESANLHGCPHQSVLMPVQFVMHSCPCRSYKLPRYPWFDIWVLVPCATLVVLGIKTSLAASVLVLDMLWDSARLLWHGL